MNVLDAKITAVAEPVWLEKYQKWSVEIRYNCWGSESTTQRWFADKAQADAVKVGDMIYV